MSSSHTETQNQPQVYSQTHTHSITEFQVFPRVVFLWAQVPVLIAAAEAFKFCLHKEFNMILPIRLVTCSLPVELWTWVSLKSLRQCYSSFWRTMQLKLLHSFLETVTVPDTQSYYLFFHLTFFFFLFHTVFLFFVSSPPPCLFLSFPMSSVIFIAQLFLMGACHKAPCNVRVWNTF